MKRILHVLQLSLLVLWVNVSFAQTFTSTPVTSASVGNQYTYGITATDPSNSVLTFTSPVKPAWLTLSNNGQNSSTPFGSGISQPGGVAGDAQGNTYVAQLGGSSIYKIAPDGTTTVWATRNVNYGSTYGMACDANYLYVGYYNCSNGYITKINLQNPSAGETIVFNSQASGVTNGGVLSMTIRNNSLYAAMYCGASVYKIDLANNQVTPFITTGLPTYGPFGVGFDNAGNLFVATWNNRIVYKYTGSTLSVALNLSAESYSVSDIKFDANGNLYLSLYGGGIRKYNSTLTSYVTVATGSTAWGMSLTPTGALVYGSYNENKVYKLQTGAVLSGTPASSDIGAHNVSLNVTNGNSTATQNFTINVTGAPTIAAMPTITKVYGDAQVTLTNPLSNSAGAFSYASNNPAVASVSGNTITFTGAGTATITATQAPSGFYTTGTTTFNVTVNKQTTVMGAMSPITKVLGDAPFQLTAPTSNSPAAVTYSSNNSSVATVSGNTVTIVGLGSATITASQAATTNFTAASTTAVLTVNANLSGPANINNGILMWLDASAVDGDANSGNDPANNSALNIWKDRSGWGKNATTIGGQNNVTYLTNQINGKPVIRFTRVSDAVGSAMQAAGVDIRATANPDVTIFTVYKSGTHDNSGQGQAIWGNDNGTWDRFVYNSWAGTDDGITSLGPVGANFINIPGAGTPGAVRLHTGVYDHGTTNGSAIYFNGAVAVTFTDLTNLTDAQTSLKIGLDGDNGAYNGDIAEMIVYNRKLTDCEILEINEYLGAKYGITFTSATISSTAASFCAGGSLVLNASAGNSFQWYKNGAAIEGATSSTYTATTAGSYTVDITSASGCTATSLPKAVTVNALPVPAISAMGPVAFCAGGSVTLASSGTTGNYLWSNGATTASITVTASGDYTLKVTDVNGCSATSAATPVTVNPIPTFTFVKNDVNCAGGSDGSITINSSSAVAYSMNGGSFQASNEFRALRAGTYSVVVKSATDCISAPQSITVGTVPDVTKPVITAPADITTTVAAGQCNATVNVPAITVTDNCQNPPGSALNFDGVNDQVSVANGLPSMTEMTIETWLNPKNISNWDVIMNYNTFVTGDVHFQFFPDGKLEFSVAGNAPTDQFTTATFTGNQWYHFAAVYSSTAKTVKFYLNGKLIDTRTYTTARATSANVPFTIGNWANQRPFDGDLDDLRIWNVAKTEAQIQADMNKTLTGSESGLLAYYNFNQGTACANNTANTSLTDLTGNRNGVLENFALSSASCNSNWTNGAPTNGITITNNRTNTANASGSFPIGTTQITWTATDASGNAETAVQTITVLAPQVGVQGNTNNIANGDVTPSVGDDTDFGTGLPNQSITKTFRVRNNGTAPLTVSGISVSGSNAANFTVSGITFPLTIPVGGSNDFNVRFLSSSVVVANATITVNSNDCDESAFSYAVTAKVTCTTPSFTNTNLYVQGGTNTNGCDAVITYPLSATGTPAPTFSYVFTGATTGSGNGTGSGQTFNKGVTHVTVTASNACASPSTSFDVTVVDNVKPAAITKNITLPLNAAGSAILTPAMIDNGSSDNCGPVSLSISSEGTLCGIAGEGGSITITAPAGAIIDRVDFASYGLPTGECGNFVQNSCHSSLSRSKVEALALNQNSFTIGANNNVFGDPCGGIVKNLRIQVHYKIAAASTSAFSCANVGTNNVTLTVTDAAGNVSTANAVVTVVDNIAPVAIARNLNVSLNSSGTVTVDASSVNNGSSDACGGLTYSLSKTTFDCSNVGDNAVVLTVTDKNGNASTANAVITVRDVTAPFVTVKNTTVALNASGVAMINVSDVVTSATDACGDVTYTLSKSTFDCTNRGNNTITVTVTDKNNNATVRNVTVTVVDNTPPTVLTQNIEVVLNAAGQAMITPASVDNNSFDNCGIVSTTLDKSSFDCSDVGDNTVTLTVRDAAGNTSFATATVKVIDNTAPNAITKNLSVALNANGQATITAADIDNNSNDACGVTLSIDKSSFDCSNVGRNTVILTVTDASGNVSTATAQVTVIDNIAPNAITKNIIVALDANGKATITAADVNNNSNDACGVTVSIDKSSFDCSNTGENTVTLTVKDASGNTSTATALVTVIDNIAPNAITKNITVALDANGKATITAADVNNNSNDACGVTLAIDKSSFDCSNVGRNTVTLTVTDASGNASTATAQVTVIDNIAPTALAKNITISLDAAGTKSITAAQIDNGSNDACGVTLSIDKSSFDCSNVGSNTVTLTVTDASGNISTATAQVTVVDNIAPIVITKNITIALDANGNRSITAAQIDNGSNDACGVTLSINKSSFNCSNVGANTVILTATDANGNVASAPATVTVIDNIAPVVKTKNISVYLSNGTYTVTAAEINDGSADACGIASMSVSPNTFTCGQFGNHTVTLTVTDKNGNLATATAVVTILGNTPNVSVTVGRTDNTFTGLNANTVALGYGAQKLNLTASNSNTGTTTYSWSPATALSNATIANPVFAPTSAGTYTYTVTAKNQWGCSATSTVTLTVMDVRCGNNGDKVIVCQVPPGNPANPQTICIAPSAVATHLAKGSYLGNCRLPAAVTRGTETAPSQTTSSSLLKDELTVNEGKLTITATPNPTPGFFTARLYNAAKGKARFEVIGINGTVVEVRTAEVTNNLTTASFDLSGKAQGMYKLRAIDANGKAVVTTVLIQR